MAASDRPAVDQLRRLTAVLPLLVNVIFFSTGALVMLGPRPSRARTDADITLPYLLVREPTDRWVLLIWWAATICTLLLVWTSRIKLTSKLLTTALQVMAPILVLLVVYIERDESGLFVGGSWRRPLVGAAIATVLLWLARLRTGPLVTHLRGLLTCSFALAAFASFAMSPLGLRDPDSFRYTADELLAPAIGAVPYSNFAPQYSALLGYPISIVARFLPSHSIQVVLTGVLLMQISTVISALWLVRSVVERSLLPAATAILLAPVILTSPDGYSSGSYHANLPLRMFLPTVLIAYAYHLLRHRHTRRPLLWQDHLRLGFLAGVGALNNPEYGGAALVSILLLLGAIPSETHARLQRVGVFLAGTVASAVGLIGIMAISGHPPRMQSILVFQRLFGAEGFFAWPMPASGLSVLFVAAFATAAIVGLTIVRHGGYTLEPKLADAALQLAMVGTWTTLCLPYYVGRSLTPTLLGGFGMQLGWILASSLPLVGALIARARIHARRGWEFSTLGVIGIMIVVVLGMVSTAAPSIYVKAATAGGTAQLALLEQARALRAMHLGSDIDQLLDMPASTALLSGVPSHAIVSSPAYLRLSRELAAQQCAYGWPSSTRQVILERSTLLTLRTITACASRIALESATPLPGTQPWWLAKFRSPTTA